MSTSQTPVFENYIDAYKNLTTNEKRAEIISELKNMLAIVEKLSTDLGIEHEILLNKEILDLSNSTVLEDDYLEAVFVYVISLQDSLGAFLENISPVIFE